MNLVSMPALRIFAALVVTTAASCNDPAAAATVLDLTVRFDDALALDRVRVTISVDTGDAFAAFVAPSTPRPLASGGEALEVLLPDDVGGHKLTVSVEGLAGDETLASGEGVVDVVTGRRSALVVEMVAPGQGGACGDGVIVAAGDGAEGCDDGGTTAGDGCAADCTIEPGHSCTGAPSVCSATCGDGIVDVTVGEACDDENIGNGDGCSSSCAIESGFACTGTPSVCTETCGDGSLDGGEGCDDDALTNGDGCSSVCTVEAGFVCSGEPSVCTSSCGNGVLDADEDCDDDNAADNDGCAATCGIEPGFACTGQPSICARTCDNGQIDAGETCDDGGLLGGDGCSASCTLETGFTCAVAGVPCLAICGDGLIRGSEGCDDQNSAQSGCNSACAQELGFHCTGEPSVCVPACLIGGVDVLEGALDPANPCRACRSAIDATAFSEVDDDTACDDDLFCNGVDTCSAGVCQSAGSPCTASQPLCLEAAALCSCAGSSCSNGSFCDGSEACGANGDCQPGTPLDCAPATCSESASGCVECAVDGDCAAPNPSCFQQRCTECPTCPCKVGEHDGGAGECVPVGDCSPGFARGFVDTDLDGVGAGAQLDGCDPFPFGAGLSAVGSDCNASDGSVFRELALFADNDLDGFTLGSAVVTCIGATVPANRREVASPPPNVSFEAASVTESNTSGRSWDTFDGVTRKDSGSANIRLDAPEISETLSLTNLDLRVTAGATIRGIAVHIRRRTFATDNGNGSDRTVALLGGSGTSANRADVTTPWPFSFTEAVYGGPTDLWGMSLTQAQVNATTFGVRIDVQSTAGANNVELELDHVWVEVFTSTGDDCADANPLVWSTRASFVDADTDGFALGAESDRCLGSTLPSGVSQRSAGSDCFDSNGNVHPGQTSFFSVGRGDGSFDYNCVNGEEKQALSEATSCSCNTLVGACVTSSTTFTPPQSCGATNASNDVCVNDATCVIAGTDIGCSVADGNTATVRCR